MKRFILFIQLIAFLWGVIGIAGWLLHVRAILFLLLFIYIVFLAFPEVKKRLDEFSKAE